MKDRQAPRAPTDTVSSRHPKERSLMHTGHRQSGSSHKGHVQPNSIHMKCQAQANPQRQREVSSRLGLLTFGWSVSHLGTCNEAVTTPRQGALTLWLFPVTALHAGPVGILWVSCGRPVCVWHFCVLCALLGAILEVDPASP